MADDWFRRVTWSDSDAEAFFTRLNRSRTSFHKAQYLRIQALTLAQTRQLPLVHAALDLLERIFCEFPEASQLTSSHLQAARCYEQLGDLNQAVNHFRLSLDAKVKYPNHDAGTALEFSWFVVEHGLAGFYDEALSVLKTARLAFPVQFFKAAAILALIAESQADHQTASQQARVALKAAGIEQSQFRYHRSLGLVGAEYESAIEHLSKIAAV